MKQFLAVTLILCCVPLVAEEPIAAAYDRLLQAPFFAIGGVGIAGVISKSQRDYERVLSDPSAAEHFENLYVMGNRQAKAYALLGIYKLNRNRFNELAARAPREITVARMAGCVGYNDTLGHIIDDIEAGKLTPQRK